MQQIIVPKSNKFKYGYLSNDSSYGFFEDDQYWPTVTHYIEAKKFEGTQYEADVRKAKTALQARRKTRERDAIAFSNEHHLRSNEKNNNENVKDVESNDYSFDSASSYILKERSCGLKKLGFKPRQNWTHERHKYLATAVALKFKQNKRILDALIATYPLEIVSSDRQLSTVLTELRETEINKLGIDDITFLPAARMQHSSQFTTSLDMNHEKNQYELFPHKTNLKKIKDMWCKEDIPDLLKDHRCLLIRNTLILIAIHISDMECCDKIYPEMIYDAIYNLYKDNYLSKDEENGSIDKCGIIEKLQNFPNISKQTFPNFFIYGNSTRLLFLRIINSWNEKARYKIRQNRSNKSTILSKTHNSSNGTTKLKIPENIEINEASAIITKFIAFCNFNKTLNSAYNRCKFYFSGGKIINSAFNVIIVPYSKRSYRKGVPARFRKNKSLKI
jgi:predicted NAD-dependent protein-ADP-ribosyltransferase YbiA (DUF1768 family)